MFNSATRLSLMLAGVVVTATGVRSGAGAQTISLEMCSEALSLMRVCRADYDRLCGDVSGRILACLQNHADQLSPACAHVMSRAEVLKNSAINAGVLPK